MTSVFICLLAGKCFLSISAIALFTLPWLMVIVSLLEDSSRLGRSISILLASDRLLVEEDEGDEGGAVEAEAAEVAAAADAFLGTFMIVIPLGNLGTEAEFCLFLTIALREAEKTLVDWFIIHVTKVNER